VGGKEVDRVERDDGRGGTHFAENDVTRSFPGHGKPKFSFVCIFAFDVFVFPSGPILRMGTHPLTGEFLSCYVFRFLLGVC
jgi:hypothetical protein